MQLVPLGPVVRPCPLHKPTDGQQSGPYGLRQGSGVHHRDCRAGPEQRLGWPRGGVSALRTPMAPPKSSPTSTGGSLLQRATCRAMPCERCRWAWTAPALPGVQGLGASQGAPGGASPRHSCSSSWRAELSARHRASMCGVKQNFSRKGDCSCCRLEVAEECSRETRTPPANMLCTHLSTTTSTTAGTGG